MMVIPKNVDYFFDKLLIQQLISQTMLLTHKNPRLYWLLMNCGRVSRMSWEIYPKCWIFSLNRRNLLIMELLLYCTPHYIYQIV